VWFTDDAFDAWKKSIKIPALQLCSEFAAATTTIFGIVIFGSILLANNFHCHLDKDKRGLWNCCDNLSTLHAEERFKRGVGRAPQKAKGKDKSQGE
jgi:hypothetical protein